MFISIYIYLSIYLSRSIYLFIYLSIYIYLDLSDCQLMQMPDAVYHLMRNTPLVTCNLSSNVIAKIPPKFPLSFSLITGRLSSSFIPLLLLLPFSFSSFFRSFSSLSLPFSYPSPFPSLFFSYPSPFPSLFRHLYFLQDFKSLMTWFVT